MKTIKDYIATMSDEDLFELIEGHLLFEKEGMLGEHLFRDFSDKIAKELFKRKEADGLIMEMVAMKIYQELALRYKKAKYEL